MENETYQTAIEYIEKYQGYFSNEPNDNGYYEYHAGTGELLCDVAEQLGFDESDLGLDSVQAQISDRFGVDLTNAVDLAWGVGYGECVCVCATPNAENTAAFSSYEEFYN